MPPTSDDFPTSDALLVLNLLLPKNGRGHGITYPSIGDRLPLVLRDGMQPLLSLLLA